MRRTHSHLLPLGGPGTQGPYPQCSRGKVWANGAKKGLFLFKAANFALKLRSIDTLNRHSIMNHEAFVSLNRQRLHSQEETECCQEACFCKKLPTMSGPKMKDTPRSFSAQPEISYQTVSTLTYPRPEDCVGHRFCYQLRALSGSAQRRSQMRPVSGTSVGRVIRFTCHCFAAENRKVFQGIMLYCMGTSLDILAYPPPST